MEQIGYVNSEGGPVILADAAAIPAWSGADGADYDLACDRFDADESLQGYVLRLRSGVDALLWELLGAGTVLIYQDNPWDLLVVRPWLAEPGDLGAMQKLAEATPQLTLVLGEIPCNSRALAILWAPENGGCVTKAQVTPDRRPQGEMSIDSAGLLVGLQAGSYRCLHEEVKHGADYARRLRLQGS